jgi:hypothetical protein
MGTAQSSSRVTALVRTLLYNLPLIFGAITSLAHTQRLPESQSQPISVTENLMKGIIFISVLLLFNITLTEIAHSQNILLQAEENESITLRQIDLGQFQNALRDATTSYSSKEDLDRIPPHSLYNVVFVRILSNESVYRQVFSQVDWELIESLPTHSDASILMPQLSSMKSTCFALSGDSKLDLRFEQSLRLFVETAQQSDVILDNHYSQAYEGMSESGRKIFDSIKEEFRGTNNLVFSTTDFGVAARKFPETAKELMAARCQEINELDTNSFVENRTLKDDVGEAN